MLEIYCDESRPEALLKTKDKNRYMILGGLWLPNAERKKVKKEINRLREKHNVFGEFKWTKVCPSRIDFFLELVDYFFLNDKLRFRCIVVDCTKIDDAYFNDDHELGFYKFYYQLLYHWCEPRQDYWIFLDYKRNKQYDRLHVLERILNSKTSSHIKEIQAINSSESLIIQLVDVLIGAVGHKFNGYETSKAKSAVIDRIQKNIGDSIKETYCSEQKFNVFNIRLR